MQPDISKLFIDIVFDYRTYLSLLQENVMDKHIGFDIDSRKKLTCRDLENKNCNFVNLFLD